MISRRPWLLFALAGYPWAHLSLAQTGTAPGGFGSPPPLPGSPGATTTPGPLDPRPKPAKSAAETKEEEEGKDEPAEPPKKPVTPPPVEPGTKPPNPFGFDDPPLPTDPQRPGILAPGNRDFGTNGASSSFGGPRPLVTPSQSSEQTGTQPKKREENPINFTAPGFFGSVRQNFSSGEGRFAKPRYRYGGSIGMGFDDNYQQTPTNTGQDASVSVQIIPAVPELTTTQTTREFVGFRFFNGVFNPVYRTNTSEVVLRPAQPEQRIETPIPAIPESPRLFSVITTADVFFNTQWAKSREAFTLDLRLGMEYYWDREIDPLQYNGSLSLLYIRKLSSRMQLTANSSITHQTQPDFSQVNVNADSGTGGSGVTNAQLKFDLGYRWAPRFNTNTSASAQMVMYDSTGVNASNNLLDVTLSNELRYIWSSKTTYVLETRYTMSNYLEDPLRNSTTIFVLLGADKRWSRRLTTTARLGQALRTFDEGGNQSSPYGELAATYQPSSRSQFSLNSRYGFEATQQAGEQNVTFRTSLNYSRALTPKLSAVLGLTYLQSTLTFPSAAEEVEFVNDTIDGSATLSYRFNRRFNMNARYSYTNLTTSLGLQDYDRSRFFLTGSYEF